MHLPQLPAAAHRRVTAEDKTFQALLKRKISQLEQESRALPARLLKRNLELYGSKMKAENSPRGRKAAPSRNSPAALLHQKRQAGARRQSSPVLHGEVGQLDRRKADQPASPDRIANGKNKCSETRSGSRACQQSSEGIYPSLRDLHHILTGFFFIFF